MGSNNGNESRMDKNPPDYIILAKWIFEIFILAVKPFVKALRIFETCVLVNNNLCEKLVSSSPIIFGKRFKVNWVPFLLLILIYRELENFTLKVLIVSSYIISKQNKFIILKQFLEKIKNRLFCFFDNEKHFCISCFI